MASTATMQKNTKSKNSVATKKVAPPKKATTKPRTATTTSKAPSTPKKPTTTKNTAPRKATTVTKKRTKIVVKCNCGFTNNLYLRGEGIKGLSWEKGTLMQCTKADEWVWETDKPFTHAEIKVLVNDKEYELGENHDIMCGKSVNIAPKFITCSSSIS